MSPWHFTGNPDVLRLHLFPHHGAQPPAEYDQGQSAHSDRKADPPMSSASAILAELQNDAAAIYHKIERGMAAVANEAAAAAPVAVPVLEDALGALGLPGSMLRPLGDELRRLAATEEIRQLAAAEAVVPEPGAEAAAAVARGVHNAEQLAPAAPVAG